uniref:Secreted protein n=1 Tax=Caenorhabditis tropicalis TaxID=1561998 RepID=A0A1I7TI86_9PELO
MWLTIFIFLVAYSHAKSINSTSYEDEDLVKIANVCIPDEDYQELGGTCVSRMYAQMYGHTLVTDAPKAIGLEELRHVLGFRPPGPWKPYRSNSPNETELAALSTTEEYYELREPQYLFMTPDSVFILEKSMPIAVEYMDRRLPEVRNYYRKSLKAALGNKTVNRDTVDEMIKKYREIEKKVEEAAEKSRSVTQYFECWDAEKKVKKSNEKDNKTLKPV